MKINTKKQLNLPQLIELAWNNGIKNKGFESERTSRAYFDCDGYLSCTRAMEPTDTFTVEVEEEITEDTVIPKMLLVYESEDSHFVEGRSFKGLSKSCVKAIYILNDDHTMTLIWRDGKLVE